MGSLDQKDFISLAKIKAVLTFSHKTCMHGGTEYASVTDPLTPSPIYYFLDFMRQHAFHSHSKTPGPWSLTSWKLWASAETFSIGTRPLNLIIPPTVANVSCYHNNSTGNVRRTWQMHPKHFWDIPAAVKPALRRPHNLLLTMFCVCSTAQCLNVHITVTITYMYASTHTHTHLGPNSIGQENNGDVNVTGNDYQSLWIDIKRTLGLHQANSTPPDSTRRQVPSLLISVSLDGVERASLKI